MYKVDLHTHSMLSSDGNLKAADFRRIIEIKRLDYIAITDHNDVSFAQDMQAELGQAIIVGEEISTTDGDMIGLYLKHAIPPGLSAAQTAEAIQAQGGLVYIPHPFERLRQGIQLAVLDSIVDKVDIVEIHNGRAWSLTAGLRATAWASQHHKAAASSSDSHGRRGWGKTYSQVADRPTPQNLVKQLQSGELVTGSVGLVGRGYPKFNKLRKKLK